MVGTRWVERDLKVKVGEKVRRRRLHWVIRI